MTNAVLKIQELDYDSTYDQSNHPMQAKVIQFPGVTETDGEELITLSRSQLQELKTELKEEIKAELKPKARKKKAPKDDDEDVSVDGVDPLLQEEVDLIKEYLLNRPGRYSGLRIRNYTIFVLGIHIGRRINDLFHLKFHRILESDGVTLKTHICMREQKTRRPVKILINEHMREALTMYLSSLEEYNLDDYLFHSRKKDKDTGEKKPLTPNAYWRQLQDIKRDLGLDYLRIGTHSLRKTGANFVADTHGIETASEYLGHSNVKITERYCKRTQRRKDMIQASICL